MARRLVIQCDLAAPQAAAALALARTAGRAGFAPRLIASDPAAPPGGRRAAFLRALADEVPWLAISFGERDDAFAEALADLGWADRLRLARPGLIAAERSLLIGPASGERGPVAPLLGPPEAAMLEHWRRTHLDARLTPGLAARPGRLLVLLPSGRLRGGPFADAQDVVGYLEALLPAGREVALRVARTGRELPPTTKRRDFRFEADGRLDDRIAEAELVVGLDDGGWSKAGMMEAAFMGRPALAIGSPSAAHDAALTWLAPGEPFPAVIEIDAAAREALFHDLIFRAQIDLGRLEATDADHLLSRRPFGPGGG